MQRFFFFFSKNHQYITFSRSRLSS